MSLGIFVNSFLCDSYMLTGGITLLHLYGRLLVSLRMSLFIFSTTMHEA